MRRKFYITIEVSADVDRDCCVGKKLRKVANIGLDGRVHDRNFFVQAQCVVGMFDDKGKEVQG